MTAREMLREAAKDYDRVASQLVGFWTVGIRRNLAMAAALRALADRLDTEEARAIREAKGFETAAAGYVSKQLLARLDAPLDVDPTSTTQVQRGGLKP